MGRYPVDTDNIKKGDVISVEDIERIMSCHRKDADFWRKALQLRSFIERDIYEGRGEVVTLKGEGDGLRVLTDEEAAEYNQRRFWNQFSGMRRTHVRKLGVDVGELSGEQAEVHRRQLTVQAAVIQSVRATVRRMLNPTPVERSTPRIANE